MPVTWPEIDWYETPRYYDMVFEEDTQLEGTFLEAMVARWGSSGGKRVLEPACGSGRLVLEMARRGWRVTGFDKAEAMLAYARERLRAAGCRARIERGRMESFRFRERFDLAHCLVSTFKYLLDEASARSHLECVARALEPGGIYVLGVHLTAYERTSASRERWVARRGRTKVVCNIQGWPADRRKRTERIRSRLEVTEDGQVHRAETNWVFRTYDARQLRRLLRSVPRLEHVATHGFHYDAKKERPLDGDWLDCVLVLRRRPDSRTARGGPRRRSTKDSSTRPYR